MDANTYHFGTEWRLPAGCEQTYAALADLGRYPQWWPQVRRVERVDEDRALVEVRSFLPYTLSVRVHRVRADPQAGVLEVALGGDMSGWSRWMLRPTDGGCAAGYEQHVVVHKPLLRRLGPGLRPVFRRNHEAMMRAGERGLRAALG